MRFMENKLGYKLLSTKEKKFSLRRLRFDRGSDSVFLKIFFGITN